MEAILDQLPEAMGLADKCALQIKSDLEELQSSDLVAAVQRDLAAALQVMHLSSRWQACLVWLSKDEIFVRVSITSDSSCLLPGLQAEDYSSCARLRDQGMTAVQVGGTCPAVAQGGHTLQCAHLSMSGCPRIAACENKYTISFEF